MHSPLVDPELRGPQSVDPEPGLLHSVNLTAGVSPPNDPEDEETSVKESESENERGDSSSDEEAKFSEEQAQKIFDDFIVSLPLLQCKTIAVLLMHSFKKRLKMSVTNAA